MARADGCFTAHLDWKPRQPPGIALTRCRGFSRLLFGVRSLFSQLGR
jgi:hypothetical protein